jgi:hypothetical protein
MRAYHCYEQLYEPHQWYEIELLIQLISVWYWKKHGGSMGIYTEEKHLKVLEKYGIDKEYDFIDHKELKKERGIDSRRFWAISKIKCQLAIPEQEYVILDTDAYFRELPELHEDISFTGMHNEHHLTEKGKEVYPSLEQIFSPEMLSIFMPYSDVMPINTCFLHINDKKLVEEWADLAMRVAKWQSSTAPLHGEMMTVEQRLLPMLAESQGKLYSALVENVYLPGYEHLGSGSEWTPDPAREGNLREVGKNFFHLWGFKKNLTETELRKHIMRTIISDLRVNLPEKYDHAKTIFPTLSLYFS